MKICGVILLLGALLAPLPAHAAIKAIARVLSVNFDGTNVNISLLVIPTAGGLPALSKKITVDPATLPDSATLATQLKTGLITFALNQYGVTLLASEIAIIGGIQ